MHCISLLIDSIQHWLNQMLQGTCNDPAGSFSLQLSLFYLILSIIEERFNSCFIYVFCIWSHGAHLLIPVRNFISVACMWLLSFFLRTHDSLQETRHYETQVCKRSTFSYTLLSLLFRCRYKHLSYLAVFI